MRCTETAYKSGNFLKHPSLLERFRSDNATIIEAHDKALVYDDGFTIPNPLKIKHSDLYTTDGLRDIYRLALQAIQVGVARNIREAIILAFQHRHRELAREEQYDPCAGRKFTIPQKKRVVSLNNRLSIRKKIKLLDAKKITREDIAKKLSLTLEEVEDIGFVDKRFYPWRHH